MSEKRTARQAILDAFRDIVLERGYDGIRVLDVVERSGVARSTFYEHFQSREDLLLDSMRVPMESLSQLAGPTPDLQKAVFVLEHFRQNRTLAKSLLDGESTSVVRTLLAELIVQSDPLPPGIAQAVAGAQLGVIAAWLDGSDGRSANELAQTLRQVTTALIGLR
ncbi:MAG TPA: TetR/AcrR family transcriptional regulator [Candidatus Baltobacteraceae bacterium]|jgi:AcrR family transcriptional regulator|nr:TetR/AcrR family transcriptional regulator [Candidatus Baltobacteraceae bacterium]